MPVRVAAVCGLLVPLTSTAALLFGGLAQPDAFSSADDDISDFGAETAASAWIYNRIGTNLTGLLLIAFALGLWRALSPDIVGRLGAGLLAVLGTTIFLEGFFTLDCRGIDSGCENDSWRSDAHHIVSGISAGLAFAVPLVLALAFRRNPRWRDTWLPTLLAVPAFIVASIAFSAIGDGAATRAGAVAWSLWLGFTAFQLLRKAESGGVRTEV
jgi:Protein of unknown function (DUF998)